MTRTTGRGKEPRDYYPTPQWAVDALAERCAFTWPDHVYDIGSGDGRIGYAVHRNLLMPDKAHLWLNDIVMTEILDGLPRPKKMHRIKTDFLSNRCKLPPEGSRVLFVSNPPFSLKFEIIRKTIDLIDNRYAKDSTAVFLLSYMFIGSLRRAIWIQKNNPSREIGLAPRLSFTKGSTDATEYAWVFWKSGRKRTAWFEMAIDPSKYHIALKEYDALELATWLRERK